MRKKFRVNQSQLECINMTRAFISMMESGKRTVSKNSSKLLADKFNELAKRISVNLNLDDEYFSRTPAEDARYYCNDELKNADSLSYKQLDELVKIEKKFDLDDLMAYTCEIEGIRYIKDCDYTKAFVALNNSLGKYKELRMDKEQIEVYMNLALCKIRKNCFEDAVFFYKQAICYARDVEDLRSYYKASYSLALAYSQMGKHEQAIDIIENTILSAESEVRESVVIKSKLTRATIMLVTNQLDDAAREFYQLEKIVGNKDIPNLSLIYTNLAEVFYKKGDYEQSLKYVSHAQSLKVQCDKPTLPHVLGLKGKVLLKQGLYEESLMLFDLAIDMAEQYKRFEALIENYRCLVKVLETKKDYDKIKDKMYRLLDTLETNQLIDGKRFAIYKLAHVEALQGNHEESIRLLNDIEPLI
jgi:tetratricopeptide (TPR) repeat protein